MKILLKNATIETTNLNEAIAILKSVGRQHNNNGKIEVSAVVNKPRKFFYKTKKTMVIWTEFEINYVKQNYDPNNHSESLKKLNRAGELSRHTKGGISAKIYNLKLKKS